MARVSGALQGSTALNDYLQHVEKTGGSSVGRLKIGRDSKGRTVVSTVPHWSLKLWIINTFGRKTRKTIHNIHQSALAVLVEKESPKPLVKRVVRRALEGGFPSLSRREQNVLINGANEKINLGVVKYPLTGLVSHPDMAFSRAKEEEKKIRDKLPDVSVADVQEFFEAYQALELVDPGGWEIHTLYDIVGKVRSHFRNTHQAEFLHDARHKIYTELLEALSDANPRLYRKKLRNAFAGRAESALIAGIGSTIVEKSTRTSRTGDLVDLITLRELTLYKDFLPHMKRGAGGDNNLQDKLKKELDEVYSSEEFSKSNELFKSIDLNEVEKNLKEVDVLKQNVNRSRDNLSKLLKQTAAGSAGAALQENIEKAREKLNSDLKAEKAGHVKMSASLHIIGRAREQFHHINSTLGRRWSADVLRSPEFCGEANSARYRKLERLESLAHPLFHHQQLERIKERHDEKPCHPRVVIEGGGPVGLMLALKEFEAGADVTLLEKRDAHFNRPQIVRLDNQWVNDLRYYLGEQFDELFNSESGTGRLQDDGSGHIVIYALEDALHNRLSELIALAEQRPASERKTGGAPLQRRVAHTVKRVQRAEEAGGKYRVTSEYNPKYDPTLTDADKAGKSGESYTVEADILICAGGKGSPTRDQFFNTAPHTLDETYGVASWQDRAINNEGQKSFPAIRAVIPITSDFQKVFRSHLNEVLNPVSGTVGSCLSETARHELSGILGLSSHDLKKAYESDKESYKSDDSPAGIREDEVRVKLFENADNSNFRWEHFVGIDKELKKCQDEVCRLRTFENKELVYLGMKMPSAIARWINGVDIGLKNKSKISDHDREEIKRAIVESWFQSVADHKGYSARLNLRPHMINSKFAAVFPVTQDATSTHHTVVSGENSESDLTVLAVGDAATSPHFMSASGLSGGRETLNIAREYTLTVANGGDTDEALRQVHSQAVDIEEFVLGKGTAFLDSLNWNSVRSHLQRNAKSAMDDLVRRHGKGEGGYAVQNLEPGRYRVIEGQQSYKLTLQTDGRLYSRSEQGNKSFGKLYTTFEHFALENLH